MKRESLRYEDQSYPAKGQKSWPGIFGLFLGSRHIPFQDGCNYRKGIVALTSCHIELKAPKPFPIDYPKKLRTIGDHIRKKRFDLKLLQKDAAKIIGVSEDTITGWENGRSQPQK